MQPARNWKKISFLITVYFLWSITGIDTPTKFRTSLRYLRQVLGEVRMQCLDDKDSGVRTGSEPASPLTSEGENDGHLVSSFIEKLPFPVGDLSQHRYVAI